MSDPLMDIGKIAETLPRFRFPDLYIDGVEVTQSLQYRAARRHLTDQADRGPDNSLQLVADKTALVRVYLRHRELVHGIVGSVTMQRTRWGVWVDSAPLEPLSPGSISAEPNPDYAWERRTLNASLNFRIPAAMMRGSFRLKVTARLPGQNLTAERLVHIDASLLQTLRIRGIPIRYDGADAAGNRISLPAPTLADFQATAGTTLSMFPVSQTPEIGMAGTFSWSQPLLGDIEDGRCPTSWINLLYWLSVARTIDGNRRNVLYYGLFDPRLPIGEAAGCAGGGGVGAGARGDGMTMAHELGHILNFMHTPCGFDPADEDYDEKVDVNYPAYEPYDTSAARMASIGEYGVDLRSMWVHSPRTSRDFMSYCGPRWISIYQMRRLVNNPVFDPRILPGQPDSSPPVDQEWLPRLPDFDLPRPPWDGRRIHILQEPPPVPLIVVTGTLVRDRIDVGSVWRLRTGPTLTGQRLPGAFAESLDRNGAVLQRVGVRLLRMHACGCGCGEGASEESQSGLIQAFIPDTEHVARVRILRGEEEIWSRESPGDCPEIADVSASVDDCELSVHWHVSGSGARTLERAVQWSGDEGKHWQALAVRLEEDSVVAGVHGLPSRTILVRVIVSDGFRTRESRPVSVDIPRCSPTAAILWPRDGATVSTSEPVRLWGLGNASDGRALDPEHLHWVLDGQRVGSGSEIWAALQDYDGEHEAVLTVHDGDRTAIARVVFSGTCSGRQPQRLGS